MDFVAIDFETANEQRDSACSCGVAIVRAGQIVETKQWLIRPKDCRFEPINVMIHGIDERTVRNCPEFNEVWPQIWQTLDGNTIAAHNAGFDMSVLRRTANLYDIALPTIAFSCTRVIAKHVWPGLPSYQLTVVADRLGVQFDHHKADEDARACAEIALKACKTEAVNSFDDLANKLGFVNGSLSVSAYHHAGEREIHAKAIQTTDPTGINADHPLFGKGVVFTGALDSMTRQQAWQRVADFGGIPLESISRKANFLVTGWQDFRQLHGGTISSKLKKAYQLIEAGQQLEIIPEIEFLRMCDACRN